MAYALQLKDPFHKAEELFISILYKFKNIAFEAPVDQSRNAFTIHVVIDTSIRNRKKYLTG